MVLVKCLQHDKTQCRRPDLMANKIRRITLGTKEILCSSFIHIMGNWAAQYTTPSSRHSNHFKPSSKQVTTIAVGPCLAMETLPIQNKE